VSNAYDAVVGQNEWLQPAVNLLINQEDDTEREERGVCKYAVIRVKDEGRNN
jgi:hypothetical protein